MRLPHLFALLTLFFTTTLAAQESEPRTFVPLGAEDGLCDNQVLQMLQLEDGRMVFTTAGNVNLYDGSHISFIHTKDNNYYTLPSYKGCYHLYLDSEQRLWVKDYQRLLCMDLRNERYVQDIGQLFARCGVRDKADDFFVDTQHNIWLVTAKGVRRLGHQGVYKILADAGSVYDLDVEGGRLYLFHEHGEVVCYDLRSTRMLYRKAAYTKAERALFRNTSLVVKAPDGIFYQLRTGDRSGFFSFNPSTQEWKKLMQADYTYHTLIITKENIAYITCPDGYWQVDLTRGKYMHKKGLTLSDGTQVNTGFNTACIDRQGGIWMGSYRSGLFYSSPYRSPFVCYPKAAAAAKTFDGMVQKNARYTFQDRTYNAVFTDSRGWTWCGMNDGLALFTSHGKRVLYTEDGLCNNLVHAIAEDHAHNIWVDTSYGISRLKIGRTPNEITFTSYQKETGIQKNDYLNGRALSLNDGRIAMEGVDGWTVFNPAIVEPPYQVLNPILTNIYLDGERLRPHESYGGKVLLPFAAPYIKSLELGYQQNSLCFEFAALNYMKPEQTYYRYRLTGKDQRWHVVSASSTGGAVDAKGILRLSFLELTPGQYVLEVGASMRPDKWDGKVCRVSFVVLAPWWRTTTAYWCYGIAAALLLAGGIALYLHLMRLKMQRKHKDEILLMRMRALFDQQLHAEDACNMVLAPQHEDTDPDTTEQRATPDRTEMEFINKATALVEQNLDNPKYSVEQLSRELCMERTGLYKKLTALLDKSPTLFIRNIRLKKAAELLETGTMNVQEISEKVGFCSPSYMGKCFQEEYGCKPSEYIRKHHSADNAQKAKG